MKVESFTASLQLFYSQVQRQSLFWSRVYFSNIAVRPEIVPRTSSVDIHIGNISNSPCRSLSRGFFFYPRNFNVVTYCGWSQSCVIPAHMPTTSKLPLKTQDCVRPPTALRPLQSVGEDGGGMRRVIYEQNQSKLPPTHTPCVPPTNQLSRISARAAGYRWRGLKPASPLPFPCWHHQGGLPYSRGVQFVFIPTGLFCLHIFIPNKQTTDEVYQPWFCLAGRKSPRRTLDTLPLHRRALPIRKYPENRSEYSHSQCANYRSTSPIMRVLAGCKDVHALYRALTAAFPVHGAETLIIYDLEEIQM